MVMMVMKMTVRKVMINLQSPHHRWRSSCASSSGKTRGTRYIQCGRCRTIDSHDNEEEEEEMEEDGDDDDDDDDDDDEDYDDDDDEEEEEEDHGGDYEVIKWNIENKIFRRKSLTAIFETSTGQL